MPPGNLKIIAYREGATDGPDFKNGSFLLALSANVLHNPAGTAQVLLMEDKELYPPHNVHSILARGYWVLYDGGQDKLPGMLEGVEDIQPTSPITL